MRDALQALALTLLAGLTVGGCAKEDVPAEQQTPAAELSKSPSPAPSKTSDSGSLTTSGFDVNSVRVVSPQLGEFPYVGLIEGYKPAKSELSKDVPFDRYEFFDGTKIIPVEGRLSTVVAEGTGAAAHEILKTYESLVTGLGGVKVYEGVDPRQMKPRGAPYGDRRHRKGFNADRAGVYMLRTPDKEVWVEAYFTPHARGGPKYFLTVVEKQVLETRAALLPAEEMKKELDAKGHVALYINFAFDKADIQPDSRPIIDEIVKLLQDNPGLNVTVEGHTDNVGAPDYNKGLSDARAKSVVAALTARGIEARRLTAVGYGQGRPIADNSTDEGRAQNRRVELVKAG